jgi:hypothetical protein
LPPIKNLASLRREEFVHCSTQKLEHEITHLIHITGVKSTGFIVTGYQHNAMLKGITVV